MKTRIHYLVQSTFLRRLYLLPIYHLCNNNNNNNNNDNNNNTNNINCLIKINYIFLHRSRRLLGPHTRLSSNLHVQPQAGADVEDPSARDELWDARPPACSSSARRAPGSPASSARSSPSSRGGWWTTLMVGSSTAGFTKKVGQKRSSKAPTHTVTVKKKNRVQFLLDTF